MYTLYSILEDGSEVNPTPCKTLSEVAEQLLEWVSENGIFNEAPEPGDPHPGTLPPCFGIKFNEHHAMALYDALKDCHATADR